VGYASTCNSVGQTAGYFLGYVVFLALESPDFCNNYLRSTPDPQGLVTFAGQNHIYLPFSKQNNERSTSAGFLYFWSLVFVVTTTLVMLFKKEEADEEEKLDLLQSYKGLVKIVKLPNVKRLMAFLLTCKVQTGQL
jgi:PAT family acetyl-CoA transporter-like MFS transporter 1